MRQKIAIGLVTSVLSTLVFAQTDLNQATEIELDGLHGLGPAATRQILAERQKSPFKDWPDALRRIKGIGPQKASRLSEQGLRVQGAPYPSAAQTSPKSVTDKP